jgi:crotonobetainyl-CoA:carnitine CoA-transferase CaiB-like acyl-CoA transferase
MTFGPGILRAPIRQTDERKAEVDVTTGPVPVRDGYFALTITRPHFWRGASRLLGLGDLSDDPRLQVTASRNAHAHLFVDRLQAAMRQWTKADLFARLSEIPVVAGPVFTMAELDTCEQLAALFHRVDGTIPALLPTHAVPVESACRARLWM